MNRDARLMSGILLITVPTIQYGGYFLLRLFSGQMPGMKPSPLQTSFFRAGHAHAGVLVMLSLICQMLVEHAALGPGLAWLARIGVPLAAILIPASVLSKKSAMLCRSASERISLCFFALVSTRISV